MRDSNPLHFELTQKLELLTVLTIYIWIKILISNF